jgi:hypothetical protein
MMRPLAINICAVLLFPVAAVAQGQCSNQILKGHYILAGRGYIEPGEPGIERVHRGFLVFDGAGAVAGKQSSSRGGKIGHEKLQGTYSVEPECTGTMVFSSVARPGSAIHWDIYITPDGRLGEMLRTDEGSMATRRFYK